MPDLKAAALDKPLYNRVALIGVGLLGGSIARAVRSLGLCREIYGYSRREETRHQIRTLNLCDKVCTSLGETVAHADLVVLCTPVGTFATLAQAMAPFLKPGTTLTDVGSVKMQVMKDLQTHISDQVDLIPGHPIAGTENSGPQSGFAELFMNRWTILTPAPQASMAALERLTTFWQTMGSQVEVMSPQHHDLVLAMTSHFPHLAAYSLVSTASGLEDSLQSEIIKFSAGGFRDSTRIAASDPTMWRDIFLNNKDAILQILSRYRDELTKLQSAILDDDGEQLYQTFSKTRATRQAIVEAGQAGQFDAREPETEGLLSSSGFLGLYGD